MDRCVHTLIYSHFWVAAAATALGWQTFVLLGRTEVTNALTLYLFSGTIMAYSLQRWIGISVLSTERQKIVGSVYKAWPWLIVFSGLTAFWAFLDLRPSTKLFGILAGSLSLLYVLPINSHQRIRDIPRLKIFLISIVWALATVILPATEGSGPLNYSLVIILFCSRALFIFAITLPFDLRDQDTDIRHQTLTLPILLGWPKCRRIGLIALSSSLVIDSTIAMTGWIDWTSWMGNIITIVLAMWMLVRTDEHKSELFFSLWIDGLMFLPWLTTYILNAMTAV